MKELINIKKMMTSREIAEVAGKSHDNVLKAIRNIEPAWEKVCGVKFNETPYIHPQNGQEYPQYELTKRECLYVATKFNDEARTKLVIRWEELETKNMIEVNETLKLQDTRVKRADESAKRRWLLSNERKQLNVRIASDMQRLKAVNKELNRINFDDFQQLSPDLLYVEDGKIPMPFPNKGNLRRIS